MDHRPVAVGHHKQPAARGNQLPAGLDRRHRPQGARPRRLSSSELARRDESQLCHAAEECRALGLEERRFCFLVVAVMVLRGGERSGGGKGESGGGVEGLVLGQRMIAVSFRATQ